MLFIDNSNVRCVLMFTLRDSPLHYINVSVWGNENFIDNLKTNFHIADVGK